MYNTYKEIVSLLNLMNTNDRRGRIEAKDIFEKNGSFKKGGEDLLIKKATGYISFVRGENPYTFPYRIYPNEFAKNHTFSTIKKGFVYPSYQMNLKRIKNQDKKRILSLYLNKIGNCNKCGVCQYCCYRYIIYNLRNKNFSITTKTGVEKNMPTFENMESFGYTLLQIPLESLIISYPIEELKEIINALPNEKYLDQLAEEFKEENIVEEENIIEEELGEENIIEEENLTTSGIVGDKEGSNPTTSGIVGNVVGIVDPHILTGKKGIERMMNFKDEKSPPEKGAFEYKNSTLEKYGRIFSREKIGQYSIKIKTVLDFIINQKGDFQTNFQGFMEMLDRTYLLVGTEKYGSTLAFQEYSGILKLLKNRENQYKNKPLKIEFEILTEANGFTFQALTGLELVNNKK
jgi:hypothetical protein